MKYKKVIEIVTYKLGKLITNFDKEKTIEEEDIQFAVKQAETVFLNYTHRCDIPSGAYYIWADMAIDVLKDLIPTAFQSDDSFEEEVLDKLTSIKVGDTQLNLGSGSNSTTQVDLQNALLSTYASQLQNYRVLPRGCGGKCNGY